jgi:hypothetical protein|uniref:Uncharacterized protein n=2 Tax=Picea TaxID=3328 RepID=A0A101LX06_PICGL|nr:hypothetical protein ABT39_MTgene6340 [Picea glauca]QHR92847.1 hypothetical protein Q903MT_gene6895 [Picea sitchensis]
MARGSEETVTSEHTHTVNLNRFTRSTASTPTVNLKPAVTTYLRASILLTASDQTYCLPQTHWISPTYSEQIGWDGSTSHRAVGLTAFLQPPACKFVRIQYAQSTVTAQIPHSVKSAFPSHIRLPNPLSVPSMKDRLKKYRQVYIREIPHPESVSEGSRYEDEV